MAAMGYRGFLSKHSDKCMFQALPLCPTTLLQPSSGSLDAPTAGRSRKDKEKSITLRGKMFRHIVRSFNVIFVVLSVINPPADLISDAISLNQVFLMELQEPVFPQALIWSKYA